MWKNGFGQYAIKPNQTKPNQTNPNLGFSFLFIDRDQGNILVFYSLGTIFILWGCFS